MPSPFVSEPSLFMALGTAVANAPTKSTVQIGTGLGFGTVIGLVGGTDDPMLILQWVQAWLGVIGLVLAVVCVAMGVGWYLTADYFANQKQQDEERWNERFLQLRTDTRAAFQQNAENMNRVTTMLENAAGMRTPSEH